MRQAITVDLDVNQLLQSLNLFKFRNDYLKIGIDILANQKRIIDSSLERYIDEDGNFDANMIEQDWFPPIKADIFISHSHQDEENVLVFAGMINKFFNKICFIDSCCWNYCDDLTTKLETFYANQKKFEVVQYAQSHVHIMLSVALSKMISNTECLMFFKTPASISLSNGIENYTYSPWIYSELQTANIILDAYEKSTILSEQTITTRNFSIKYQTEITRFLKMNQNDAFQWFNQKYPDGTALRQLYNQLTPERKVSGVRRGVYIRPEDYIRRR